MAEVYECGDCSLCCRKLIIEIDHIDVVREPTLLPAVTLLDGNGKIQYDSDWEKQYRLTVGEPCPKLTDAGKCSIYPTRPNCCVAFEAGGEECQHLRHDYGMPPLVPVKGGV